MAAKRDLKVIATVAAVTAFTAMVVELWGRKWLLRQFKMADEECLEDAPTKALRNELQKRETEASELMRKV